MPKNDGSVGASPGASWRSRACSIPARARAETRIQRFLDAAFELMTASPGREFTVQEVVERSGQSLRSFYQYFEGKYELLVALFEDSVRSTAETPARGGRTEETDPLEPAAPLRDRVLPAVPPGAQDPRPARRVPTRSRSSPSSC